MKKIKLTAILLIVFSVSLIAQTKMDALRYSQITFGGTARYMGTGGAFGALGADFSTLSVNPAGIGLYKSSEFTFTPSIFVDKTESKFNNGLGEDIKYNFNFSNIGLVMNFETNKKGNSWKSIQFGFGINRLGNFNNRTIISGSNTQSSLMDDYLVKASGNEYDALDPFDTELAWNTWLIDTLGGSNKYTSLVPAGGIKQTKEITTSGSMNEFVITLGGNYSDKLYIAGTIGIPYINYKEHSLYTEEDNADTIADFHKFNVNDELETSGTGINVKFGMIFRATDWVRIGAAVHSPTFFTLNDNYSREIKSYFDNGQTYTSSSPNGEYEYKLTTPMRIIGSIAFIIGKYGLISADYEYIDYADARFHSSDKYLSSYSFSDVNNDIIDTYNTQQNIRVGGEINLSPFKIRGGYALYGSPFKSGLNDLERTSYTFGLGLREKNYFIDLAYVYNEYSEDYYLYSSVGSAATLKNISSNFLLTLGVRF